MLEALRDKKGIFFDIGWTLCAPRSGDWMWTEKAYAYAGRAAVAALDWEKRAAAEQAALAYLEGDHRIATLDGEEAQFCIYYRMLLNDCLGFGLPESALRDIAHDRTYNMANYVFFPEAAGVLGVLTKTHRLGVISDTWPSVHMQLSDNGLTGYFFCTTFSCDLGVFKPDARMYEDALEKIGLPAQDCVFIDDTLKNLDGAARMGITPILITVKPGSDVETPYTKIRSLSDLIG